MGEYLNFKLDKAVPLWICNRKIWVPFLLSEFFAIFFYSNIFNSNWLLNLSKGNQNIYFCIKNMLFFFKSIQFPKRIFQEKISATITLKKSASLCNVYSKTSFSPFISKFEYYINNWKCMYLDSCCIPQKYCMERLALSGKKPTKSCSIKRYYFKLYS